MHKYDIAAERAGNTLGILLQKARLKKGLLQKDVVERLHEYGGTIKTIAYGQWERGIATPNPYQLFALCMILDIEHPLEYFAGADEYDLHDLNELGRRKVSDYIEDLSASGRYRREKTGRYVRTLRFTQTAAAGVGNYIDDSSFEEYDMPSEDYIEGTDFVLELSGDSMEPGYHDGQVVCVEKTDSLEPGEVGIFIYDGDAYIKVYDVQYAGDGRISAVRMVSLNPKYPPKTVERDIPFAVVGRVLS